MDEFKIELPEGLEDRSTDQEFARSLMEAPERKPKAKEETPARIASRARYERQRKQNRWSRMRERQVVLGLPFFDYRGHYVRKSSVEVMAIEVLDECPADRLAMDTVEMVLGGNPK